MKSTFKVALAGLALAGSALGMISSAHAYSAIGSAFPGAGNDPNGPGYLIVIDKLGKLSISATGQPSNYDGSDDSYIGIQNNYGKAVNSIDLKATVDIFGFDGDGINGYISGFVKNSMNPDQTGYGGPDSYFSNYPTVYAGTVNFAGGLQSGQQTYFSLEEDISTVIASGGFSGGVSGVPLPASLPMFGGALMGLGAFAFAKKRRKVSASAV